LNTSEVEHWITLDQASDQLGISTAKVRRLIDEHILFAVRIDKQPMMPAHLISNGEPLSSIRGSMLQLIDAGFSSEEAVDWLYAPNDFLGEKPIDSLLKGHKAPVRRAAQSLG